jgi:preprotein translocase subunit SecF
MAQWIKPGINIDFYGRRKAFWALSAMVVLTSLGALAFNAFVRGDALNYGIDFKGGSQIQIEFARKVSSAEVRAALTSGGFRGAEVLRVEDTTKPSLFMLRLTEVSAFSEDGQRAAKQQIGKEFGSDLKKLRYKDGSDKVYLKFNESLKVDGADGGKAVVARVAKAFERAGIATQQIQLFGRAEDGTFQVQLGGLAAKLEQIFSEKLGKDAVKDIPQVETVGAKMGKRLRDDGIKSMVYALFLMLLYIAIRFDFRYAPGAVIALMHDVTIVVGLFAVTWTEFSLPVVAALLTVAGYSINDTIVVYDRIRENVGRMRDRKFELVVNASINQTLSRTVLTSLTTLFTCVAIWVMGTGVLRTFAFALVAGVVVGTYSSILIASPLLVYLHERFAVAKRKVVARG